LDWSDNILYGNRFLEGSNMKSVKNLIIGLLVLAMLAISVIASGCNTVQGMGEDIEKGGEGIQEIAD
jgi:predicted small secreted protein